MNYSNRTEPQRWTLGYNVFDKGELDLKWVDSNAKEFATFLGDSKLTGTQLRAFYNEFIRIRDIQAGDLEKKILIKLLAAKVSYRGAAKATDIPPQLSEFIANVVEQVGEDMNRFKQACYVMEAIVGFFPKK